jgi:hypothetical protein
VPGNADGYSGQAIVCSLGSLFGVGLLTLPVTLLVLLTDSLATPVRAPLIAAWGIVYGITLAWGGTRHAASSARIMVPELNQIAAQTTF